MQLYTTRKVVNCMNDIQIMFYNLVTFFFDSWIAFLFIITMLNYMFIVRYFTHQTTPSYFGSQSSFGGMKRICGQWIIYNCLKCSQKMIFCFHIICNDMYERQFNLYFITSTSKKASMSFVGLIAVGLGYPQT